MGIESSADTTASTAANGVASPKRRQIGVSTFLVGLAGVFLLLWPWLTQHSPYLSSKPNAYLNLGTSTLIIAILVYSLNIAMGYSGLLSLMHTGFLGTGAYAGGILANKYGWSFGLILPVAIIACAALGVVVTALSLRATYLYFGVITLSFNVFLAEIGKEWTAVTNGEDGLAGIPNPESFTTWYETRPRYFIVLAFLVVAILFHRNVIKSKSGRAFQAVRESGDAAAALGVRSATTKMTAAALSGGLAGVAGILFAFHEQFMNPSIIQPGDTVILFGGLLLGGTATVAGPLIGVISFTLLKEVIKKVLEVFFNDRQEYSTLILGVLLWLILLLVPKGIVGTWNGSKLGSRLRRERTYTTAITDPLGWAGSDTAWGTPILIASKVSKSFGGVKALQGVDVAVLSQEVHGIIGPNGSGKSTFVNCATSHLHRDSGTIEIFGQPVPDRAVDVAKAGVVRVFQVPHLFERVSVLDNVLTGMHLRSKQTWLTASMRLPVWAKDENRLRDEGVALLGLAGLASKADWLAANLSHGQKRLLEVARAVGAHPKILILDEPATGLSSEEIASLAQLIRTLKDGGLSIILIEHNVEFVMAVCDRITVFEQGQVIAVGSPSEIRRNEDVQRAYLGGGDVLAMIRR
jgi:ABC-type branched-subunit amino acid transport system ATPase component/ABC-type branched-subunit amino acid transport system permease subunit